MARTMRTRNLFNTTFRINHPRLMLRQETRYLLQYRIEELILRHCLDNLTLAENNTLALTTRQAHISIARLARTINHTAHHGNMNGRLYLR